MITNNKKNSKKICNTCNDLKDILCFRPRRAKCRDCVNKQRRDKTKLENSNKEIITKKVCNTCNSLKDLAYYKQAREKRKVVDINISEKKCNKCSLDKNISEFCKGSASCKICVNKHVRARNKIKREKLNELKKLQPVSDSKPCSKCKKSYLLTEYQHGKAYCRPCGRQMCRDYKARNRDKVSAYNKKYKAENKKDISEYNKKYFQENKEAITNRRRPYYRERKKTDPKFKICCLLRNRLRVIIKLQKATKTNSTLKLLGCSLDFLLEWFKFRFEDNMTLNNHGKVSSTGFC